MNNKEKDVLVKLLTNFDSFQSKRDLCFTIKSSSNENTILEVLIQPQEEIVHIFKARQDCNYTFSFFINKNLVASRLVYFPASISNGTELLIEISDSYFKVDCSKMKKNLSNDDFIKYINSSNNKIEYQKNKKSNNKKQKKENKIAKNNVLKYENCLTLTLNGNKEKLNNTEIIQSLKKETDELKTQFIDKLSIIELKLNKIN